MTLQSLSLTAQLKINLCDCQGWVGMADFSSYLSDTDESAVGELIAQAEDLVAIEHLSSLNHLSSHNLPSHLESRFQNLKSFPPRLLISSPSRLGDHGGLLSKWEIGKDDVKREEGVGPKLELEKMGKHKGTGGGSSGSNSSSSFTEDTIFMPQKENPVAENENPRVKSRPGALPGQSGGFGFNEALGWGLDSSPSPPRKGGCFWCSLKKKSSRKNKDLELDMDMGWGKHEELLSDLGSFSTKEQRRVLKEAMKEQERLSKEAEKIVRIAQQASARMQVYGDNSDDETKL